MQPSKKLQSWGPYMVLSASMTAGLKVGVTERVTCLRNPENRRREVAGSGT